MSLLSAIGAIVGVAKAVVNTVLKVVELATHWVYHGMAVLLDIFLPKAQAKKVARFLATGLFVGASAYLFYLGWKLLWPVQGPLTLAQYLDDALRATKRTLGLTMYLSAPVQSAVAISGGVLLWHGIMRKFPYVNWGLQALYWGSSAYVTYLAARHLWKTFD